MGNGRDLGFLFTEVPAARQPAFLLSFGNGRSDRDENCDQNDDSIYSKNLIHAVTVPADEGSMQILYRLF